jgi:SMI1-KNR4 cell-wall
MLGKNNMTTSDSVLELERHLGLRLPEDFRSWLLDPEAPYPVPSDVNIPDESTWIDEVSMLLGAEQILSDSLQQKELLDAGVKDFPSKTLRIGDNEMGDHYLLSLRANDFGSVYFYFHETANPEEDDDSGIYILSESFTSWLSTLSRKEPNPNIPDWDRIREEQLQKILSTPSKRWWQVWK